MTTTSTTEQNTDVAPAPTLVPYINVADARAAIDWYVEVFGGHLRGEPFVMEDGRIGHAEVGIGDAVLMLSEPSPLYPEVPVAPPVPGPHSHTLHLEVSDVDAVTRRAAEWGAGVEREPTDAHYGRGAVIVDPFGHRWMLLRQPGSTSRVRQGEIVYTTLEFADDERAKAFYGSVLGWRFQQGRSARGWIISGQEDRIGLAGGSESRAQLAYKVDDIEAAVRRVREAGGTAEEVSRQPYGLMSDCVDDQGTRFNLWQPVD